MASLDAIGIIVSDISAAVAFYELLGLEFAVDAGGHREATTPSGVRVMLDSEDVIRSFHPDWRPGRGDGRHALAFLCASPAEVDDLTTAIAGAGYSVKVQPFDAPWGQRYATVVDPDGNAVDLFAAS